MQIVWSDDDAVPEKMREAIKRSSTNARVVVVLARGDATDAEVQDALCDFQRRQCPAWFDEETKRRTLWATPSTA